MILSPDDVLDMVPQRRPFRFIDRLLAIDDERILGVYRWREEDCRGNPDPGRVPAFALLEMAAQIGNVAWCIHHMSKRLGPDELRQLVGVFTEVRGWSVSRQVRAGETVSCLAQFGQEGYFRAGKLVAEVTGRLSGGPDDGVEVFSGVVAGMWVPAV